MKKTVVKKNRKKFDFKQFKRDLKWYALGLFMNFITCPIYTLAASDGTSLKTAIGKLIDTLSPVLLIVGVVLAGINLIKLMNKKSESQGEAVVTKEVWGIAGGIIIAAAPMLFRVIENAIGSFSYGS